MAVPPTVPTSFVPRSASSLARGSVFDFGGAFAAVGYGALAIALLMAAGVFIYGWILSSEEAAKRSALQKAEAAIDTATVESFIHLDNQLTQGKQLLDSHLVLSSLFELLESLSPTTVRLTSFTVSFKDNHAGVVTSTGTAASFNALAALSAALGKDSRVKNAIFSNITVVQKGGGVAFTLSADLDPAIAAFSGDTPPAAGAPVLTP